jgi:hypothetical protein
MCSGFWVHIAREQWNVHAEVVAAIRDGDPRHRKDLRVSAGLEAVLPILRTERIPRIRCIRSIPFRSFRSRRCPELP